MSVGTAAEGDGPVAPAPVQQAVEHGKTEEVAPKRQALGEEHWKNAKTCTDDSGKVFIYSNNGDSLKRAKEIINRMGARTLSPEEARQKLKLKKQK